MQNRFVQVRNVKNGQIFTFNGEKYKYEQAFSAFRQLYYANNEVVKPKDMPMELILEPAEVEIIDNSES